MSAPPPHPDSDVEQSVARLLEISQRPTLGQRLISWASRPPGHLYLPACTLAALGLVVSFSVPGWHLWGFAAAALAGGFLAMMGALRLGIALTVARPMIRHYWLRWITAPVIAAITLALAVTDAPLHLRLAASSDALMELAEEHRPDDEDTATVPVGERAGLFTVDALRVRPDGTVQFSIAGAGLVRPWGLAHNGDGLETDVFITGHDTQVYTHLHGPWYAWRAY